MVSSTTTCVTAALAALTAIGLCSGASAQSSVSFVLDDDSAMFKSLRIFEQQPTGVWVNVDRPKPTLFSSKLPSQTSYYSTVTYKIQLIRDNDSTWPISFDNISFLLSFEFLKDEDRQILVPINIPRRIDNTKFLQLERLTAKADMLDKFVQSAIMYFHLRDNIDETDRITQRIARIWMAAAYALATNRPGRVIVINDELSHAAKDSFDGDEEVTTLKDIHETFSLRFTDLSRFDSLVNKGDCDNAGLLLSELKSLAIEHPEYLERRSITQNHLDDRDRKFAENCESPDA